MHRVAIDLVHVDGFADAAEQCDCQAAAEMLAELLEAGEFDL